MALFDRRKNDGTVIAQEAGKPNTPYRHDSPKIIVNPSKKEMQFYDGNEKSAIGENSIRTFIFCQWIVYL